LAYSTNRGLVAKDLAVILTQGRATCSRVVGLVQEPTKDTVPVRDLFTLRIALRLTTASQVDMVLGESARLRGALADEIPAVPETAGIGYVVRQKSRVPMRFRAAFVDDSELNELVKFVLAGRSSVNSNTLLKVVA